jgi:transposase-like protein
MAAREKTVRVIQKLRTLRLTKAAELVESAVEETLTYYAFLEGHWRGIRTNNQLAGATRAEFPRFESYQRTSDPRPEEARAFLSARRLEGRPQAK